jgi:hypothetical protein
MKHGKTMGTGSRFFNLQFGPFFFELSSGGFEWF